MLQELILLITELMMRRKMESNSSGQNSLNMSFPKIILIFYLDSVYHVIGYNKELLEFIFNKTNLKIKFMRNFGRKFEFLSHTTSQRGFWIGLFLLPIEFIGNILNRDVYYEAYISKEI